MENKAYTQIFNDILGKVLQLSENPSQFAEYLTQQIRELIGARTVVIAVKAESEPTKIFSVFPARRTEWANQHEVLQLAELSVDFEKIQYLGQETSTETIALLLKSLEIDKAISIPLIAANRKVGSILLLDIMDEFGIESVIDLLTRLSGVFALVIRSSIMYQNMENLVATRTCELQNEKERIITILNQVGDPIFVKDNDHRITLANRAFYEMFGMDEKSVIGYTLAETVPENEWHHFLKVDRSVLDTGVPDLQEEELTVGGFTRSIITRKTRFTDESGNRFLVGSIHDITESKQAEVNALDSQLRLSEALEASNRSRQSLLSVLEDQRRTQQEINKLNAELEHRVIERTSQLEAVNKELEAFSYSVSHDLRAPLRHISGFADMLSNDTSDKLSEKAQHYLSTINDAARKMGILIDDLLSFSRTGRAEMRKTTFNMNLIIEDALKQVRMSVQNRKIEWGIAILPEVFCDYNLMRQVWVNLIENAVKYTRKQKMALIQIDCHKENEEYVFSIRDNGAGFDMKYAQKLFGVFQRLHSSSEFEGTGIGLANVRRIVIRHGGRTWAEAELGKGATFYFSLPEGGRQ